MSIKILVGGKREAVKRLAAGGWRLAGVFQDIFRI